MYKTLKQSVWLQQTLVISSTILSCIPTHAQIIPDNTLGTQGSRVIPNTLIQGVSSDLIDGGATRGSNLFLPKRTICETFRSIYRDWTRQYTTESTATITGYN